jgi:apolipoprotein N-acyltransferase
MSVDGMRKLVWIAAAVLVAMFVFGIALSEVDKASKTKSTEPPDLGITVEAVTTNIWDWVHNQPQQTSPPVLTVPPAEVIMP